MSITYQMLADTVPTGVTLDTVRTTDLMFTDGEASGAVAKLIHGDYVMYVWSNGRIWARSGDVTVSVTTWIAALQKPRHDPDTKSSDATLVSVV